MAEAAGHEMLYLQQKKNYSRFKRTFIPFENIARLEDDAKMPEVCNASRCLFNKEILGYTKKGINPITGI